MKRNTVLMRFTFSFTNIAISPFVAQHLDNKTHHLEMFKYIKHEGGSTGDIKNNSNIVNYYRD